MFRARPLRVAPQSAALASIVKAITKATAFKTLAAKAAAWKPSLAHGTKWMMRMTPWIRKLEHGRGRTPTWLRNMLPAPLSRNLRAIYAATAVGATASMAILILSSVEYYEDGVPTRYRLMIYSPKHERFLGKQACEQLCAAHEGKILPPEHPLTLSVDRIVRRLVGHIEHPFPDPPPEWQVYVVDSSTINAMALPSGDIFIHCGMIEVAEDEACCAAVLAHEISHVCARHTVESLSINDIWSIPMNYFYSWMFTAQFLRTGTVNAFAASVLRLCIELPFSRAMETEADLLGLNLVHRSGYDCHQAVKLWPRIEKSNATRGIDNTQLEFFSTHPCYERRINDQKEHVASLGCIPFTQSSPVLAAISSVHFAMMRLLGVRKPHQWTFDEWSCHLRYQLRK